MSISEYQNKAARYEAAALAILNPGRRQEYLDKAAEYRRLAAELAAPTPAEPTLETEPIKPVNSGHREEIEQLTKPGVIYEKPETVRVYPHLSLAIRLLKERQLDQAFAAWMIIRALHNPTGLNVLPKAQVAAFLADLFDYTDRTIAAWLSAGDGIFWTSGWKPQADGSERRVMVIRGKDKVFEYFLGKNSDPGRLSDVPADLVIGSLKQLRAVMVDVRLKHRKQRASRKNIRIMTGGIVETDNVTGVSKVIGGIAERTQYDYNHLSGVIVTEMTTRTKDDSLKHRPGPNGTWLRQLPNIYHAPTNFDAAPQHQGKRYGLSAGATIPTAEKPLTANVGRRIFYTDAEKPGQNVKAAIKAAEKRRGETGSTFAWNKEWYRGRMVLIEFPISAAKNDGSPGGEVLC